MGRIILKTIIILSHVIFDDSPYCIFVHEHAKALQKAGYNVIVFATLNWLPFITMLKKDRKIHYAKKKGVKIIDGVTVIYKKMLSFSNFLADSKINLNGISYYLTIKRKIKKIAKIDDILFVDAHMFHTEGYVAAKLHKKFGFNATVTCHGTSLIKTTQYKNSRYIISNIMNNIDYAICVSNLLKNKLIDMDFLNTKVIYNGINFYPVEKKDDIKEITILTVATLIERKNIDLVIKALKKINVNFKNVNLIIVGQGMEEKALKKITQELNIEEKVKFTGHIDNEKVYQLMRKSKIFILPSVNEGFGIVYAEAMSNGCITIGTKNEGIDGFIVDGINGFLVNPDVNDIVEKINYILKNENRLNDIIKRGIKDSKQLTWENNAREYIKLFQLERENKNGRNIEK